MTRIEWLPTTSLKIPFVSPARKYRGSAVSTCLAAPGSAMTKTLDAGPRLSEKIGPYLRRHRSMNSIGRYIQRSV